jgi:GEVED domain/Secretion system C-terminal sorting domain
MKSSYLLLLAVLIGKVGLAQTCSGTPSAGTLSASSTISCGSGTLTLSLSGETADSGIGYQWQYSSDTSTWSNLHTGTVASYSFTPTRAYYYRCQVICTASSDTANSNAVKVSYTSGCPCTPMYEYGYSMGEAMTYFSLTGYSGTSISDYGDSTGSSYEDRTSAVSAVSLQDGGSYSGYIYTYTFYYFDNQIWIDFNDDGTFASAEAVTSVFGGYSSAFSYTMNIPGTAVNGYHRMRVRNVYSYAATLSAAMDPCAYYDSSGIYYYYGTTWDYLANIVGGYYTTSVAATTAKATSLLYPNPATTAVYLKSENHDNHVTITNSLGQVMLSERVVAGEAVDIHALPAGVYIVSVQSRDGITTTKLTKE